MDKRTLKARGGFVGAPVVKSVTWAHRSPEGEDMVDTFDVFVQPRSAGVMNAIRKMASAGKADEMALMISEFIRLGEDGSERLTYEEALQLDDGLQIVLVGALNDLFEGAADPKNSAPPMNSGTTSPDSSEAAPSMS